MMRDKAWVEEKVAGEFDILMEPGENRFRSLRWDLNDFDPSDISAGNWGVWAFRGKRYVLFPCSSVPVSGSSVYVRCAVVDLNSKLTDAISVCF